MAEVKGPSGAGVNAAAGGKPEREGREGREGREKKAKGTKNRKAAKFDDFVLSVHRMAAQIGDADIFSKHGVTIGEWATLKSMGDKPEVSLRDVTKGASVSRQRLRTLLSDLEKKGFIKVARSSEKDKRTRALTVLPKRAEVVNAISVDLEAIAAKNPALKKSAKRMSGGLRVADKFTTQLRRSTPGGRGKTEATAGKEGKAARRAAKGDRSAKPDREAKRAQKKAARAGKERKAAAN